MNDLSLNFCKPGPHAADSRTAVRRSLPGWADGRKAIFLQSPAAKGDTAREIAASSALLGARGHPNCILHSCPSIIESAARRAKLELFTALRTVSLSSPPGRLLGQHGNRLSLEWRADVLRTLREDRTHAGALRASVAQTLTRFVFAPRHPAFKAIDRCGGPSRRRYPDDFNLLGPL